MPKFAAAVDFQLFELLSARLQTLATEPAVTPGRIFFHSGTNSIGIGNAAGTAYIYIGAAGALDAEQVQDIVGAMLGTLTNITVTYDDATGKLNYSVAADGAAGTATLRSLGTTGTTAAAGNDTRFHTHSNKTVLDAITEAFTTALLTKLNGIATGATANSTDAVLLARGNHTGTQLAATISDIQSYVDGRISNVTGAAPAALDTLVELAAALGNDANFATTMTNALATKATKYSVLVGNGSLTTITVTHNLNTRNVMVSVMIEATGEIVLADPVVTSVNALTVTFGTAPTTNQYRVTVFG